MAIYDCFAFYAKTRLEASTMHAYATYVLVNLTVITPRQSDLFKCWTELDKLLDNCFNKTLSSSCRTANRFTTLFVNGFRCPSKSIRTDKCFAKKSLKKLKSLCDNQNACRLQPSNKVFGDPCRGTFKYIEVTYFCISRIPGTIYTNEMENEEGDENEEDEGNGACKYI